MCYMLQIFNCKSDNFCDFYIGKFRRENGIVYLINSFTIRALGVYLLKGALPSAQHSAEADDLCHTSADALLSFMDG